MMPAAPPDGSLEQPKDRELFNMQNHMHNKQVVYFMRVYAAIVGGVVTGIIGVTGFFGILHLVVWQSLFAGLLLLKKGVNTGKYFLRTSEMALDQAFSSTTLLTFILFW
eukprot:CAMPEP_0177754504 /NCGR_PEP_ID=MMETSP0491_2-20121128/2046_1 /TAXON_ID=63592 /ORGANISM="Tetraselmis chuii, Strain PLY429" /LENGTH=108 /DNA_ID=CAMNT_0019269895 /DNA_START=223 /DNA_END=546 /DNA_ORIENTATION=-